MIKIVLLSFAFSFLLLSFISPDLLFHWQATLHGFLSDTFHLAKAQVHAWL